MEPRYSAGLRLHPRRSVSGARTLRPFQMSSATTANPEMRCVMVADAQSGEPPNNPKKPLRSERPPRISMKTLAQGCAIPQS